MNATTLITNALDMAHGVLEQVMADCDAATLRGAPGGKLTNPLSIYGHIVIGEDAILNSMVLTKTPLAMSGGLEGTGVKYSGNPSMSADFALSIDSANLEGFKAYAQKVYAATKASISAMTDAELEAAVQSPVGPMPAGVFLNNVLVGHIWQHLGEIAAIKGIRGLKGLPF